MKKLTQQGFGILPVLLVLVVVGLAGFAAYRVMDRNNAVSTETAKTADSTAVPESIQNSSDIDAASKALDETAIDDGMNADQLDSDIDSLL